MKAQIPDYSCFEHAERYLLIKEENLNMKVVSSQILAGSKIIRCLYEKVVFTDCSFYATEFQGVVFRDCIFENCNFTFCHLKKCVFQNCSFRNCLWKASSSVKTLFENCDLKGLIGENFS